MQGSLFDVISSPVEESTPNETATPKETAVNRKSTAESDVGFFDAIDTMREEPEEQGISSVRSLLGALPKGLAKGLLTLGRAMGPLQDTEFQKFDENQIPDLLDKYLPTDESFASDALGRAGETLPLILGSPGGSAGLLEKGVRTVAGAFSGAAAKSAGLPDWVQSLAEIPAHIAPKLSAMNVAGDSKEKMLNFLKKASPKSISGKLDEMLASNKSRNEILDFSRSVGMAESEITPLLQGEFKQKWLSKLATKGEATQGKLTATKKAIGRVYDSLKNSPEATAVLDKPSSSRVVGSIEASLEKMPSSVRKAIQDDFAQLTSKEISGESLIKFYGDVNHELGHKTKQLAILKDPIKAALHDISPVLGESFEMTNKLYGKYSEIAKKLKPTIADQFISKGEGAAALVAAFTGNMAVLTGIAGAEGARKIAAGALLNPRFQNLSGKMVTALNGGKFVLASKIKGQMSDMIREDDPRIAEIIDQLNMEEALK